MYKHTNTHTLFTPITHAYTYMHALIEARICKMQGQNKESFCNAKLKFIVLREIKKQKIVDFVLGTITPECLTT